MKEKQKIYEKGITLIALVITIIVLLILAGVTLSIVFNGGIIEKSQNAVDKYSQAQQNETEKLEYVDKQFGQTTGILDNTKGTENKKMIDDKEYSYNNPVIPVGFKTSNEGASWKVRNGEVSGWNEGLVIQDESGNQFVWVPTQIVGNKIANVVEYKKWCTAHIAYNDSNIKGDDLPSGVTENTQISTYGGFYIGRYEASRPSNGTIPQTQYDKASWDNINYTDSKSYAESYKSNDFVKSGLLTGTMWDTTLAWIDTGVPGYSISKSYGNNSGTKANTGKTASDCVKNIYDLAGNVREWTGEICSDNRVRRSGGANNGLVPAYRYDQTVETAFGGLRFQSCTLYSVLKIKI